MPQCEEVTELIAIRKKYEIPRTLVSNVTQISSQNIFRYEKRGVTPILLHRIRIAQFNGIVKDLEDKLNGDKP